jgi:hypothetical protein
MADEADGIPGAILARSHGGSRGPTLALSGDTSPGAGAHCR